ncbi:MAG: hypothetical protein ACJAVT_002213, partial [Yoonia sp.]
CVYDLAGYGAIITKPQAIAQIFAAQKDVSSRDEHRLITMRAGQRSIS